MIIATAPVSIGHADGYFEPSSKTEIKSESKMDVKVGDRVLVEGDHIHLQTNRFPRSAIKSVEPAPPAAGDIVSYGDSTIECVVIAADGQFLWVKAINDTGNWRDTVTPERPGFRIVKRAEPK